MGRNIKLIKRVQLFKVRAKKTVGLSALGRRRRCIFRSPATEGEGRGRGGESTFLLCCVLYGRRACPSFYCTLIYYNETGEKAGRASGWGFHGAAGCQTFPRIGLPHPHPSAETREASVISNVALAFTSIRTSVRAASCRWPSWLGQASPRR